MGLGKTMGKLDVNQVPISAFPSHLQCQTLFRKVQASLY